MNTTAEEPRIDREIRGHVNSQPQPPEVSLKDIAQQWGHLIPKYHKRLKSLYENDNVKRRGWKNGIRVELEKIGVDEFLVNIFTHLIWLRREDPNTYYRFLFLHR